MRKTISGILGGLLFGALTMVFADEPGSRVSEAEASGVRGAIYATQCYKDTGNKVSLCTDVEGCTKDDNPNAPVLQAGNQGVKRKSTACGSEPSCTFFELGTTDCTLVAE